MMVEDGYISSYKPVASFTKVTQREFDEFIKTYPNPLQLSAYSEYDPVQLTFNDYLLGVWPYCVVAVTHMYDESVPEEDRYCAIAGPDMMNYIMSRPEEVRFPNGRNEDGTAK